ncbi:hypothetical protein AAG565_07030 [Fontimonas sp. SYSU GA230001]|uniref:hypothetical protein n=1 Tax=Fontimonas sp. SYSU GA230001 TaxID=3142450 RepID=UPI0032B43C7F
MKRGGGLHHAALLMAVCCVLLPELAHAADGPPLLRRALIALVCLLGGFALCLRGWERIDRRQFGRAACLVLGGWSLGIAALALLHLSADPQTWSWWI